MIRRHPKHLIVYLALLLTCPLLAQTPEHPDGVGARFLFLDHFTPNIADRAESQQLTNGLALEYTRNVGWKYLNVVLPVKVGVARFPNQLKDVRYASVDLLLQGILFNQDKFVAPYFFAGGGMVFENFEESNVQFPVGIGSHFRIASGFYLNAQVEYRMSMAVGKDNLQYGLGFMYVPGLAKKPKQIDTDGDSIPDIEDKCPLLAGPLAWEGCPDTDGDGIPNHLDMCPDEPGPEATKGCPDRDEDGVIDSEDACPDEFGLAALMGCPDRDGDGIPDKDDACPDEPGLAEFNGCPPPKEEMEPEPEPVIADRDGDGIPDSEDLCPDIPGIASLGGCPPQEEPVFEAPSPIKEEAAPIPVEPIVPVADLTSDRDGDGVPDYLDRCPDTPGPGSNDGCPIITAEDRSVLDMAMRSVQFETGSATILADSYRTLDRIAEIMLRYRDYHLIINGHTDNVGRSQTNLALSEQRARACYNYLISRGIATGRMIHSGFGDSKPLTSNKSEEGRSLNRRVEFIMYLK